ncbi:hypothetical protein [Micromonospora sp. NPDC048830]|uniref:hypothetical protein n=1 Tax=Micromonospora sp. NPDC048830 TaxID=3364257 RepID=UPI003716AB53
MDGDDMSTVADDTATDGYCAITQIRYEIYDGGWTGHWHYREPVVDCSTNGVDARKGYYYSYNLTRYLATRACKGAPDGSITYCESTWHWAHQP